MSFSPPQLLSTILQKLASLESQGEKKSALEGLEKVINYSTLPIIVEMDCAHPVEAVSYKDKDRPP